MKNKLIDGNNMTVTGRTLGENLERWTHEHGELSFTEQDVIRPLEKPIKETGHLRCAFFSFFLTPAGCDLNQPDFVPFFCFCLPAS